MQPFRFISAKLYTQNSVENKSWSSLINTHTPCTTPRKGKALCERQFFDVGHSQAKPTQALTAELGGLVAVLKESKEAATHMLSRHESSSADGFHVDTVLIFKPSVCLNFVVKTSFMAVCILQQQY